MATDAHERLLAQLQTEVNKVLEHTGRLFVAANNPDRIFPVAQAGKLKEILPKSNESFHGALDQLEQELQLAKLVMRRDLALCRYQSGILKPLQTNGIAAPNLSSDSAITSTQDPQATEAEKVAAAEDVVMQDLQPTEGPEPAPDAAGKIDEAATNPESGESIEVTEGSTDPKLSSAEAPDSTQSVNVDHKTSETGLHIDTHAPPQLKDTETEQATNDDAPPDTGTFTNDFESLFGGPTSAGLDASGFDMDDNGHNDFDFDTFATNLDQDAADNDNISSLLPGLADYANTQPTGTGDPDFDAIFSTDFAGGQEGGDQAHLAHRDSTFDDILGLPDFDTGDFTGGTGDDNAGGNQELDFDME